MRRALDRLKRAAIRVIDTPDDARASSGGIVKAVKPLLMDMAMTMEAYLSAVGRVFEFVASESISEDYVSLLDLLFVLARTTIAPNNPVLTDSAYDILSRAARLLGFQSNDDHECPHTISPPPSVTEHAFANFVRCLSGAFHTLGGTLYQAGKYGSAIRFIRRGCLMGAVALRLRKSCEIMVQDNAEEPQTEANGKDIQGWGQLRDQHSRRWELLGVCLSKIGDRLVGLTMNLHYSLEPFVFLRVPTRLSSNVSVQLVRTIGPAGAFEVAPSLKQVAVIIDRATYMASCELLRPPAQVSLKESLSSISIDSADNQEEDRRCIIGAILERQVESLAGSLWKPDVKSAVRELLIDCASIYDSANRPIRRAGVLLRGLELSYYTDAPGGDVQLAKSQEEIEALLSLGNVGRDSSLTHLLNLHRAEMHMWLALHAHRHVHPQQYTLITQHSQEVCRTLRMWIQGTPGRTPEVKESPKQVRAARKAKGKTATVRAVAAATHKPKTSKVAPTTPKRTRSKHPIPNSLPIVSNSHASQSPTPEKAVALTGKTSRRILSLINMMIHLVGFIGQIILKLELLQVARQVCEHPSVGQHDGEQDFVQLSIQLAHEYVKLGKLREAGTVHTVSNDTRVVLLLRHAESLVRIGDIDQSIALYTEAFQLSETLSLNMGESSTLDRVHSHVNRLRRLALAANVFAEIKLAQDDPTESLTCFLQAIRLWHRAVSALSHLSSRAILHHARASTNALEWQVAEGMLETTMSLAGVYLRRGSVREAEYFIREAEQLASSMNAPALLCRALAMQVDIQLQLRQPDNALNTLRAATNALNNITGPDAAGLCKLYGEHSELLLQDKDAQLKYAEALKMLEELDKTFLGLDGPRPLQSKENLEPPVPALFSAVLRQHIWLLRNDIGDEYEMLLQKLSHLAPSADIKARNHLGKTAWSQAEERSLLAKLTLHDVYNHFQEDMVLSSIRESVLSLPMGVSGDKYLLTTTSSQPIMHTLAAAGKLFHSDLTSIAHCGSVPRVREAASSLALIQSFQSSIGGHDSTFLVANLLDTCANVTLRREMLEIISYKLPSPNRDDLRWPLGSNDAQIDQSSRQMNETTLSPFNSDDDNDEESEDSLLAQYWESIRLKYQQLPLDLAGLARSKVDTLPTNWTVVHIYLTDDYNTMFVCRQRAKQRPLIFSMPLKGRRETEDDEHLTFEDALMELREIVRLSDESTKSAITVKGQDQRARAVWWADRGVLDKRLKDLLENIEFCWFGAFKTILSEQVSVPQDAMSVFRNRMDRIFEQTIGAQGKKQSTHMHIDNPLLECFSRLSPKCRDEELEDLVYFILDLYQFYGVQVAIAEVDVDHVVVDIRTALEEHAARVRGRVSSNDDEHVFLVLNRCLQEIPWESLPILRGRSVSRVPNVDFLIDRLELAGRRRRSGSRDSEQYDGHTRLNSSSTYYILNPSGDLEGTERRFSPWLRNMQAVGWDGIIGRAPSEQEFSHALSKNELVIYFGHGGGEQYIRSHKLRHLPRCAATMLWGCSSGLLRDMGEFDRVGTPHNYMLAGCPTLIANLWDVTDRDIDKLTQAVFDRMRLTAEARDGTSIIKALAEAREVCKLKYITGAAPVVYGIPFYI
ncbi:peptidase family C50-domain-containing protein [Russula earlei]|uniref:Peptidase family C50-domain-containing protein n=1 Tax=Russula earlei TaxID=71964 RepID=A0ACC0UBC9_9AGAM|nr:peptidase family C50-domain-containing protein [Russula earlei]